MNTDDTFRFGDEEFRIFPSALSGYVIEARTKDGRKWGEWRERSRRSLLEYDKTTSLWVWLKSKGIRRPAPSGPSGASKPRSEREGVALEVWLSEETAESLAILERKYGTKRAAVEAAIVALANARGE